MRYFPKITFNHFSHRNLQTVVSIKILYTSSSYLTNRESGGRSSFISIYKTLKDFQNLESSVLKIVKRLPVEIYIKDFKFGNDLNSNGSLLCTYLQRLISQTKIFCKFNEIHKFLEISAVNQAFDNILYQGELKKKVGGQFSTNRCSKLCRSLITKWEYKWFSITEEGISFADNFAEPYKGRFDVLFFDSTVKILFGKKQTNLKYGTSAITKA